MEEIEERYKKEIENADSEFLKGLENKKDITKLGQDYKARFSNAIKKYEEECLNYLEKEKRKEKIKKNSFSNKEKRKEKIKSLSLKPGFSDKSRIKIILFFFRIKIKLKKMLNRILPLKFMVFYLSAKKRIKTIIKDSGNSFKERLYRTKIKIYSIAEKQIKIILSVYSKLKNPIIIFYGKLKELISKRKKKQEGKEEKKEEKKEEEKDGKEEGKKQEEEKEEEKK